MTGCKEHHLDVSNLDVDCSDKEVEKKNQDNIVHANNIDSTGLIEQHEHSGSKADKEEEVEVGEENITDSANQDQKMSLKEIRNQMPVTVFRSKSFAGMANARPRSAPGTPVLGETLRRSPRVYTQTPQRSKRLGLGSYKPPKIPKLPQPSRAVLMFESVKKGIK